MKPEDQNERLRLAIIDDEAIARRTIQRGLSRECYEIEIFGDGESFLDRMQAASFDLVICDLKLPAMSGLDVLKAVKTRHPQTEVIVMTGYGSIDTAVEAIRAGAFHYLAKPLKIAELRSLAEHALEKVKLIREKELLKKALFSQSRQQYLIGHSPAIQQVLGLVKKVCSLNCNVLILGESGTGKELVARALHFLGVRREHPFICFNCGGFTEELIANELFGHEKGAFTGAFDTQIGLLEAAHRGTIFLDEIGAMPSSMQVKLLRFVQERSLIRVGGIKPIPVDVRLVAAGNQDLKAAVDRKQFREDLYYRLNVVLIDLPPLRARKDDIPLLIRHFLNKYSGQFGKTISDIEPEALEILMQYPFPGNVRELENIVERAVALTDRTVLGPRDLPGDLQQLSISSFESDSWPSLEEKEKEYIRQVLIKTDRRKTAAAEILKIPRTTLWRKMKRLGLD
jgi:two-component system, NtrC family, response regulator AtoC